MVLFFVLNGERALNRFRCWHSGSIVKQRLKAEKREIIQQIFLQHRYLPGTGLGTGDSARDKALWTWSSCEWINNGADSSRRKKMLEFRAQEKDKTLTRG